MGGGRKEGGLRLPASPPAPMIPLRTYGAEKSKAKSMVSKIERLELTLPNERSSTLTTMHME